MKNNGKIIIMDFSMYSHRAAFASKNNPDVPVIYTILNMMVSNLRKIGVYSFDKIIIACDGRGNWRKQYEPEIKANRAEIRQKSGLDWDKLYKDFDWLLECLEKGTDWTIIKIPETEADDIASVAVRYFIDKEIVLVSFDEDWTMLWHWNNVKVFSPLVKYKSTKGAYKIKPKDFNAYKLLAKKIRKETSDNLTAEILNEKDYENRKICVSLLTLPDFVENKCIEAFKNMSEKGMDLQHIPFANTLRPKIANLYEDKSAVITYEDCIKYNEKKKLKLQRRNKNAKAKIS